MTSLDLSQTSLPSEINDQWDPYETPLDDPFDDPYDDLSQQQIQTNELKLCQLVDWDDGKIYDESYIRYSIEWKVTVNNRAIMPKDTEQGIVLAPAAYWQKFLEPKLEDSVRKTNRPLKAAFTSVIVSVTQRKEPNRFDETSIDWAVIESQLIAWGRFHRIGKELRLNLSFNYIDTTNVALRSGDKTMRCRGPPCNKGPYCWIDPIGKKHYRLNSDTMERLVEYVQDGNILESSGDVPHDIRKQLYDEEEVSLERRQKKTTTSAASLPTIPITITVLPAPSDQAPRLVSSRHRTQVPNIAPKFTPVDCLNTSGLRDSRPVKEYCAWQQLLANDVTEKGEYEQAGQVILAECMDLGLIRWDPNPDFLIKAGVKRGIAQHIVGDIDYWVVKVKRARAEE